MHIHCQKAEMECKYRLDTDNFDLDEAYSYNISNKDKRDVKKSFLSISIISRMNEIYFKGGNKFEKAS